MNSTRVRALIPFLPYEKKLLPKKPLFTSIPKGGIFPKSIKKFGYPDFGIFIDYFIRKVLALQKEIIDFVPAQLPNFELYQYCMELFGNEISKEINEKTFSIEKNYYKDISTFIENAFENEEKIIFEPEWESDGICGHPDLVTEDTVYDIKATGDFPSMRRVTILQLLCYFCLAKRLGLDIKYVALVLPAQKQVVYANLQKWDWEPFWKVCVEENKTRISLQPKFDELVLYKTAVEPYIGGHIERKKSIAETLMELPKNIPWQIFLSGRTKAAHTITDKDITQTLALTAPEKGYSVFIHAPYTLNLSRQYDDNWVAKTLSEHLRVGREMGCKGVVIHCGVKAKDLDETEAYNNMQKAVIEASAQATKSCPLLIETSAGETGELLSNPAELISFYVSLPEETKSVTQICIDTCHVFAAGYDPVNFIQELQACNIPIGLIHFNDSKGPCGCKHDRHAMPGTGYIGMKKLCEVAFLCKDICKVFE
jgi:endonuclease IV